MLSAVTHVFASSAGGRRRYSSPFFVVLAALAVTAPGASAALPDLTDQVKVPAQLPLQDGAVGEALPGNTVEDVVDDVVNKPLPEPVENVVQNSPVAPVRDEVRRVVNRATGDGGSGSGGSGAGAGGGTAGRGTNTGGSAGSDRPGAQEPRAERRPAARSEEPHSEPAGIRTPPRRGRDSRPPRRRGPGERTRRARGPGADDAKDRSGDGAPAAAIRTIRTVVQAVPTFIWIALGLLSLLALGLAGRTYVERRRARSLAADRDQLLGDVAALERALLPAVPERLGGVCVSVAYRSSEGPAAGGDFYDAFELPGSRAAVIVGDVSGHGPDALEGTNSVRAQLHALLETGMTPRAAIALVGERSPVQLAGRFSTVVVAIHDPVDGTLTIATAGHAPPVVAGEGFDELLSAGASPPIGVGMRTGLRQTTVALPAGLDLLLLHRRHRRGEERRGDDRPRAVEGARRRARAGRAGRCAARARARRGARRLG
jgi:hypothetical protein